METITRKHYGRVTLTIGTEWDDSPDISWLGSFHRSYYEAVRNVLRPIYSAELDAILLPDQTVWRNRRGQIVATRDSETPDLNGRWTRDWSFIALEDRDDNYASEKKGRLKYLFQDADRLRALDRGDWGFIGIVACVKVDNRKVGSASVWGFESDMSSAEIRREALNIGSEAIAEAKTWLASLRPA